jgi:hypothetical protein
VDKGPGRIEIQHVAEVHVYKFHVGIQPNGVRVLSTAYSMNSDRTAPHDGTYVIHDAVVFAEGALRLSGELA